MITNSFSTSSPQAGSGQQVLGYGWNLLASNQLKSETPKTLPIIDYPGAEDYPKTIVAATKSIAKYWMESADSFSSLSKKLKVSASADIDYLGFGGSIESHFSSDVRRASEAHVANVRWYTLETEESFREQNPDKLKTMLRTDIKAELNDRSISPTDLFKKWGTHLITKIWLGGRLDYYYSTTKVDNISSDDFDIAVEASYAGVSGKAAVEGSTTAASKNMNLQVTMEAWGGTNPGGNMNSGSFTEWSTTIKDKPVYIGRPAKSLTPLWALCDNPARRQELEKEFKKQRAEFKLRNLVIISRKWQSSPNTEGQRPWSQNRSLRIDKNYKILSGGTQVLPDRGVKYSGYHLFTASYPENPQTWIARSHCHLGKTKGSEWAKDEAREATILISVVAIFDPPGKDNEDWQVTIGTRNHVGGNADFVDGATQNSPGQLTGGGAQLTKESGWLPVLTGSYPEQSGGGHVWHARVQELFHNGGGNLDVYEIRLAPKNANPWMPQTVIRSASGENGQGSNRDLGLADREQIFVGGGVQADYEKQHFPFASLPTYVSNGSMEWRGVSGQYFKEARAAVGVYSIGLTLNLAP